MNVTIEDALEKVKSARIVVIVTFTRPKLLKKSRKTGEACPYAAGVERRTERKGMIGVSYENCVNNQRGREGTPTDADDVVQYFEAQQLWSGLGRHVSGSKFLVEHTKTGKQYLTFRPQCNLADQWIDLATGAMLELTQLQDYLPLPPKDSGRQGTEQAIQWKCIALENVKQIRSGEIFDIIPA